MQFNSTVDFICHSISSELIIHKYYKYVNGTRVQSPFLRMLPLSPEPKYKDIFSEHVLIIILIRRMDAYLGITMKINI